MTGKDNYALLKQVSILMALETGLALAEVLINVCRRILNAANSSTAMNMSILYLLWTLWALRMFSWTLTLASLSRMTRLCKSFRKAQIWYLLRILFFVSTPMLVGVLNYLDRPATASDFPSPLTKGIFCLNLALCFFAETLFVSSGNRAILFAGAELLDNFGMTAPAEKNRLYGKWLMKISLAEFYFLMLLLALTAWVWFTKGSLVSAMREAGVAMTAFRLLVLFVLPEGLGVLLLFRFLASLQVHRTYRAVKELTK